MKATGGSEAAKRRAGESAAAAVEDGMVVGLGTGSTAAYAIEAIGRAVDAGLDVVGVATSHQSRSLARDVGIPLRPLEDASNVDVAIDGADQVADRDLLKGGGAAHAREKVVAAAADRFLVVVDDSKLADRLDRPVPVEALPVARSAVLAALRDLGAEPGLRAARAKDGPVVTDNGNLVVDAAFGEIADPGGLADRLDGVPGIVAHGLFVDRVTALHVGHEDGVSVRE